MILVRYMSDRFFVRHVDFEPTDLPSLINDALVWSCKEPLRILGWLAKEGRWGATSKFAHLVVPEMQRINNLVTEHPDSVVSYSRTLKAWPVFKSPHKDYDVNHEKLLDLLQVGIGHPYKIDKTAKWNANDAIARWANHLCTSIEISMDGESITKSSPPWKKQLLGLRPFGAATWEDWWQVAKHVLMDDYVDVVKIPELSRTVKAASDRKSPGRIRKRIYEKLRDRLKSMAGENKV